MDDTQDCKRQDLAAYCRQDTGGRLSTDLLASYLPGNEPAEGKDDARGSAESAGDARDNTGDGGGAGGSGGGAGGGAGGAQVGGAPLGEAEADEVRRWKELAERAGSSCGSNRGRDSLEQAAGSAVSSMPGQQPAQGRSCRDHRASSSPHVTHNLGYVLKAGKLGIGDWQRRFIQFTAGEMRYYTDDPRTGATLKGKASLEGATIKVVDPPAGAGAKKKNQGPLVLLTITSGKSRTFKFRDLEPFRFEGDHGKTWETALREQLEFISALAVDSALRKGWGK